MFTFESFIFIRTQNFFFSLFLLFNFTTFTATFVFVFYLFFLFHTLFLSSVFFLIWIFKVWWLKKTTHSFWWVFTVYHTLYSFKSFINEISIWSRIKINAIAVWLKKLKLRFWLKCLHIEIKTLRQTVNIRIYKYTHIIKISLFIPKVLIFFTYIFTPLALIVIFMTYLTHTYSYFIIQHFDIHSRGSDLHSYMYSANITTIQESPVSATIKFYWGTPAVSTQRKNLKQSNSTHYCDNVVVVVNSQEEKRKLFTTLLLTAIKLLIILFHSAQKRHIKTLLPLKFPHKIPIKF